MSDDGKKSNAAELLAHVEAVRVRLESENADDRDVIENARKRIAARNAELAALPVARRKRKRVSEQKTGGDHG